MFAFAVARTTYKFTLICHLKLNSNELICNLELNSTLICHLELNSDELICHLELNSTLICHLELNSTELICSGTIFIQRILTEHLTRHTTLCTIKYLLFTTNPSPKITGHKTFGQQQTP